MSKSNRFSNEQAVAKVFLCLHLLLLSVTLSLFGESGCLLMHSITHSLLCDLEHLFHVLEHLLLIIK